MRILIAEDDSALASYVKKGLDAEHYAVDVSNDGEQARAMAGEFDYDLVVLDLSLPRLDGVAILPLSANAKTDDADPGADRAHARGGSGAVSGSRGGRLSG